jgi:hypothetical protein
MASEIAEAQSVDIDTLIECWNAANYALPDHAGVGAGGDSRLRVDPRRLTATLMRPPEPL